MRDAKESFGFDHYQVRSERAIERSVLLSFVAASLTQLLTLPAFIQQQGAVLPALQTGLDVLKIHWYHPARWTLGLIARYVRWKAQDTLFSLSSSVEKTPAKSEEPYQSAAA